MYECVYTNKYSMSLILSLLPKRLIKMRYFVDYTYSLYYQDYTYSLDNIE